jgi:tetratricopeptide (TPR) repeat protein
LLEIHDDWSWRNFYALVSNTIQLTPLPITGLFSDIFTRGKPETGELLTRALGDLDNDGKTEWIVEGKGYGYWASCGDLYVMDWQNGELVDRTGDLFSYCLLTAQLDTASVEFDDSQPDAIQMIETRVDGWNCQRVRTDTLNLIDDTLDTVVVYADTVWCALREAGEAFDETDYRTAVDIYKEVILAFDGQMAQYLEARLALAYALNGQLDAAQATLDSVEPDGQMGDLLLRLQAVSDQPQAMCRAAFDFFAETNRREDVWENPYEWTPENFHFGHDPDDPRNFPLPIPSQAGCDYQQTIESVSTQNLVADTMPDLGGFVHNGAYLRLMRGEYYEALSQIDSLLASPETENDALQLTYWRALTLELMRRTDEALAEYVTIYDAAPESAWGMLAALHFEMTD